jgi:type IV pilus assembly protein PilA
MKNSFENQRVNASFCGFTLIELLIVVATLVIILTLAVPTYSNYSIRSKVGESMYFVTAVKSAAAFSCREGDAHTFLNNQLVGYKFKKSQYVQNIVLSGTCEAAQIVVTTRATGAKPSPILTLNGKFKKNLEKFDWTCVSSGLNAHAPKVCRS